ncbi:MAG: ABC transporter permease [Firmicutes bacterium]|jgi:ABC-2 type transport system permease protein|nr:ABC transporter permease [Bacillota bacterium]MDH7496019.1 ABC transporter permease [Bacillota bacterium]
MRTFWQLVLANARDIGRDKMSLFWFLLFPVIFILLFGFIFSNEGTSTYDVGIVCDSGNPLGEGLLEGAKSVPVFRTHTGDRESELQALKKGERSLVVEVPSPSFAALMGGGEPLEVRVYYNETKPTARQVLVPVVEQILDEAERRMTGRPRILQVVAQPVESADLRMVDFILPGILAMALMQLGLFGAMRAVSLREQKVLKSLGATPLRRGLLLVSEVVVRITMALIQTVLIVVIGYTVFRVKILGSWPALLGAVLLGALTFVSMGYMIAAFPKTEEAGVGFVQIVQFPMMFLSGIFFPIEIMPSFLRPVVRAMPLSYLGDLLRQIMVAAPPEYSPATDVGVLVAWAVVSFIVAARFWRWE